jgi:uncharacterized phage-like protein YoqJ
MGGRKSYSLDIMIGKSKKNKQNKKEFIETIQSKESKRILSKTIDMFTNSETLVDNLSEIVNAFQFVEENAKGYPLNYDERKRMAAKFWANKKKEIKISTPYEIDRIFVDSITKVIRRGKKK